ncbi:hypothetical protein [Streptomyces sulfonofaciens]|nr:hypothetical protein [Streptomyces sulfonofaciens]
MHQTPSGAGPIGSTVGGEPSPDGAPAGTATAAESGTGTGTGTSSSTSADTGTGTETPPGTGAVRPGDGVRAQCESLLVRTHDWLERAVGQAPEVNALVPLMMTAVDLYSRGHHHQCLQLANGVRQAIEVARAAVPGLPAW